MTPLTASMLSATHPCLPAGWRRGMATIRAQGGPWACGACGGPSYLTYRCSKCGHDLVTTERQTTGDDVPRFGGSGG